MTTQPIEAETRFQVGDGEGPGMIGERDLIAGGRRGNGEHGARRASAIARGKVGGDGIAECLVVLAQEGACLREGLRRRNERKAGIGCADVADKAPIHRPHRTYLHPISSARKTRSTRRRAVKCFAPDVVPAR